MKFKRSWHPDKCYRALEDYHNRCVVKFYDNQPRRRGNPQTVLHAVRCLKDMWKSGMICEVCSKTEEIQLHHVDGQWWNYQLENLQFLCRTCHLAAHGGCWKNLKNGVVSMTWNSAKLEIMRERATAICQSEFGLSIEQAVLEKKMSAVCRVLADESETLFGRSSKWNSLYDVLKKHILSATERSTQPNDDNTVTVAPKTVTKMLNRRSVSIEDAIRIGRTIEAFEKFGITISFN